MSWILVGLNLSLDTVVSIVGIVIPLMITFIGSIMWLARKLDKIETNTDPIKAISETMIRLDERTKLLAGKTSGTVHITLKNLGDVSVSASPVDSNMTSYTLQFSKGFNFSAIAAISKTTGFEDVEKKMFSQVPQALPVTPTLLILRVPSSDPKVCSNYVSKFLTWLDTEYFNRLGKAISEYEQIKVE
jgi:hypothetical protein